MGSPQSGLGVGCKRCSSSKKAAWAEYACAGGAHKHPLYHFLLRGFPRSPPRKRDEALRVEVQHWFSVRGRSVFRPYFQQATAEKVNRVCFKPRHKTKLRWSGVHHLRICSNQIRIAGSAENLPLHFELALARWSPGVLPLAAYAPCDHFSTHGRSASSNS